MKKGFRTAYQVYAYQDGRLHEQIKGGNTKPGALTKLNNAAKRIKRNIEKGKANSGKVVLDEIKFDTRKEPSWGRSYPMKSRTIKTINIR